ncbi:MAG: hypothetical protein V2I48_12030 [Xanthomonadales bacterium]|jgi:hypothetical protein|nr:hypothetical protein [Xanthomonadales bacterium]
MRLRNIGLTVAATLAALAGPVSTANAFNIDEYVEGYWYEAALGSNRGWGFQYLPTGPEKGIFFVAGFVYDSAGNPTWLTGQAEVFDGQFEVDMPLQEVSGGEFGPGAGTPVASDWGTLNVVFHSCNKADFTFSGGADFTQEYDPFLQIVGGANEDRCVYQKEFDSCPAGTTEIADRTCQLQGTYTDDLTLTNDAVYVLNGGVFIGNKAGLGDPVPLDGPTLTIEAGTRIVGAGGSNNALYIQRGSKIIADGMPHAPIVMTGADYAPDATAGQWGGLVLNGAAPLNTCDSGVCEAIGEGDSGAYGGSDPLDNSGVLRYVRVQFAGEKINDEDELNGIAFQGVGSGTVVDYIQVHRNADDGIEFYGGTVNAKHLVLTDIEDDSVDWTQGWQGSLQYVLVSQIQDETVDTDRGMELDNLEQNNDALPRSGGTMMNFTLLGKTGELGINPRRGTAGHFCNFVVVDFNNCLDIDSAATFAVASAGDLTISNTLLNCSGTNIVENDEDTPDPWSVVTWFEGQPGNVHGVDPMMDGAFLPEGSIYLSGQPCDATTYASDFFDDVDYMGAFRSRDSAWVWGWTEFNQNW